VELDGTGAGHRGRVMCDCSCDRLHVDELGQVGNWTARLAMATLKRAERDNGMWPRLPAGTISLIQLLATSNARATPPATLKSVPAREERITTLEAARRLHLSPGLIRRWALQGRIPGAEHPGRDWSIPTDAINDLRRSRAT
jgi:hypothetical protein